MILTRFHKVLIGLFVAQLALVAIVLVFGGEPAPVRDAPLMAGFDADKVSRVRVFANGGEKPAVEVIKRGAAWVVASHFDYPADAVKIKNALASFGKIAAGEPIATAASRHKQLRVAANDFERKIVLDVEGSGQETTIYTGSGTGARRLALRLGGDAVYSATGVVPPSSEPSAYVTTKYVDVPKADIAKLVVDRGARKIEIERVTAPSTPAPATPAAGSGSAGSAAGLGSGSAAGADPIAAGAGSDAAAAAPDTWKIAIDGAPVTLAAGESIDTDAIDRLLGQAGAIDLRAPADPKRDASAPFATVTIHKQAGGPPLVLQVLAEGESSYWVRQQGNDRAILVDKYQLGELVPVERDKLVKKPAAAAGSGSAAAPIAPVPN